MSIESLGRQLREVLPTRRLLSVSLCDHEANVLWLSEGALGPDEHALVMEALELLSTDSGLHCHELSLEDGRLALFLPVRSPAAELVGIAMILADGKSLGDDTLERMAAAPVRAIMLKLAVLLKPSAPAPVPTPAAPPPETSTEPPAAPISPSEVNDLLEFELIPLEGAPAARPAAPPAPKAPAAAPAKRAGASEEISAEMMSLEFLDPAPAAPGAPAAAAAAPPARTGSGAASPGPTLTPLTAVTPVAASSLTLAPDPPAPAAAAAATNPTAPAPAPAPMAPTAPTAPIAATAPVAPAVVAVSSSASASDPNILLEVLPFGKLRAGGQSRRLQVLARTSRAQRDPAALDALLLQRLMAWLAAHRSAWSSEPTTFTVNLSIATIEDERFAQKIAAALNSHGIAGETLGFEIAEALCRQRRAQVERFIAQCEKIGAWVVIDDFCFDAEVLPLLRSRAVRLVKVHAKLSSSALKDKLSQALVVATVQAAKVLGIHCSAKKVDSQAALQWLTAIGCDFAQGAALASPQTLDSLASSPDPTGVNAVLRPA